MIAIENGASPICAGAADLRRRSGMAGCLRAHGSMRYAGSLSRNKESLGDVGRFDSALRGLQACNIGPTHRSSITQHLSPIQIAMSLGSAPLTGTANCPLVFRRCRPADWPCVELFTHLYSISERCSDNDNEIEALRELGKF